MQLLDHIFPEVEFTTEEMLFIEGVLSDPIMKKYLSHLASQEMKDLAALSSTSLSDPSALLISHASVAGRLEVLSNLSSVRANPTKEF